MPDDELDQLRAVLAQAYDKRQPFIFRLIQAVKNRLGAGTPKRAIVEPIKIVKEKDAA
jgi:hypothetical protein